MASVPKTDAQAPWINESYRNSNYPAEVYYSSYYYKYNEGHDVNKTIDSALREVQGLLANSINSKVESNTLSTSSSINNSGNLSEKEEFYNEIRVASDAKLIDIHVDYYYDDKADMVHAFAYVKKSDLASYLESQIKSDLTALNERVSGVDDLVNQGYKQLAKKSLSDVEPILGNLRANLNYLISVNSSSPQIANYSRQIEEYSNKLKKLNSDLTHNISIYIESELDTPFNIRNSIPEKCKGLLSSKGFNFVSSPEGADYILKINCVTRNSSSSSSTCYAFADVDVSVTRSRDNLNLYQDSFSVKGGALTEEKAHRRAIDDTPELISEKFLTIINE